MNFPFLYTTAFFELEILYKLTDGPLFFSFQVTGAAFGLAASLITFRGLWAAAEVLPPPPPPAVVDSKEEGREGEEEAREAEPYEVELNTGVSGSASS
jgi:hypothetical protein